MSLQKKISAWNGKSAEDILAIYNKYSSQSDFVEKFVKAMPEVNLQRGSTWLLKRHLSQGHQISSSSTGHLFHCLPHLDHWESKLHVLQSLEFLDISSSYKTTLLDFLKTALEDKNKLVRAWAYSGYHILAEHFPEFKNEKENLFLKAIEQEAPSVKARIRNIKRSYPTQDKRG